MELTAAYLAAGQANDSTTRVLVINPDAGIEHIQPLPLRDNLFLHVELGPTELATRIKAHLATVDTCLGAILPITGPPQYGSHITGGSRFVGRLAQMWDLHTRLQEGEHAIISGKTGQPGLCQVVGMGGQGKSLLVEEYALRFGAAYPGGIFWLHARGQNANITDRTQEGQEIIREGAFRDIAQRLGVAVQGLNLAELEGKLSKTLREQGQPFLWVVDDIASGLDIKSVRGWLAPDTLGKTLLTTRSREYGSDQERLNLDVLEPDAAMQLFLSHRVRSLTPLSEEENRRVQKIAVDRLGRHALAVDVAGSAALRMGYAAFLCKLDTPNDDVLKLAAQLGSQLPNGHEKDIAATFLQSINLLDKMGRDYLQFAACLAAAPIPYSLVSRVFAKADDLLPTQAETKALLATDQAAILSLAEDLFDGQHCQTVHLLIARTVLFHDPAPERTKTLRDTTVNLLIEALAPVADIHNHADLAHEVEHGRHLCQSSTINPDIVFLVTRIGLHDFVRGSYTSARILHEKALEASMKILGENNHETLAIMSNLAGVLSAQGELKRARTLQEKILEVMMRDFSEEHPDTLAAMNNLASTLSAQGDLDQANDLQKRTLKARMRVLGKGHPGTLTAMNNLASTLSAQGDLDQAKYLLEKVLEARMRALGKEHQETLSAMNNLAETFSAQGELKRARTLQEKTLKVIKRVLGEEHPHTLTTMNRLASTLLAQGELKRARTLQEETLKVSKRVLGEKHPHTLIAMGNLASTLSAQGDLDQARDLQEKTLIARMRVLGIEHFDTLKSIGNLASTLYAQGDLDQARDLQEKTLELSKRILGGEHRDTLAAMNNLAETLNAQGNLKRARTLLEKTLEVGIRILGEEHLDTLSAMNNLASTLYAQGDLNQAKYLLEKVLEARMRVLGKEHPNTLNVMGNLASILRALGDPAQATNLLDKVVDIKMRVLGREHPDTSISAWNLFCILDDTNDQAASKVFSRYLGWLVDDTLNDLAPIQRKIRGNLQQLLDHIKL